MQPITRFTDLLISQYQTSPNFIKYLTTIVTSQQELWRAFVDIRNERYMLNAEGAQLDVIGSIVGAPRKIEGVAVAGYFGYFDVPEALGIGDENNPEYIAGILKSEDDTENADLVLTDTLYRQFIRARIIKNVAPSTVEDVIDFFKLITGRPDIQVEVMQNVTFDGLTYTPHEASFHIKLHDMFNVNEVALIQATGGHIKPVGVTMTCEYEGGLIIIEPVDIGGNA